MMANSTTLFRQFFAALLVVVVVGCASKEPREEARSIIPENVVVEEEPMVEEEVVEPISAADFCSPDQGAPFSYRKKVAVLAAQVRDPQQDLTSLDVEWSKALQRHLKSTSRLIVVDASMEHLHMGSSQAEWIMELAKRLDVQFIISPRLLDLQAKGKSFGSGAYQISLRDAERRVDAELVIYDGYTGLEKANFSHDAKITGTRKTVMNHMHQPVLRSGFRETLLGQAMIWILESQTEESVNEFACMPLMERVAKVSGREIYISAGWKSMIRPGEVLQLFRRRGMLETRLGPVEVVRVLPEAVVAVYRGEGEVPRFSSGLLVRAW